MVLFPLSDGFALVVGLDAQYDGDTRNVVQVFNIRWSRDGEPVFLDVNVGDH